MDAKAVVEALNEPQNAYPRRAIQAAMDHPDEVIPHLLEILKAALEEPERYTNSEVNNILLPTYAVYLLSHHEVREAHELLIDLASLPEDRAFAIFEDTIHEAFPEALWKTCGGDATAIKGLIENKKANEYCRAAAMRALLFGVAEEAISREDAVRYFQGLFTGEEASIDESMVWNGAASALLRLWPGESMEVLLEAFDEGLIDPSFVSMESIEAAHEMDQEACLNEFKRRALKALAVTPHDALESWALFRAQAPPQEDSGEDSDEWDPPFTSAEPRQRKQRNAAVKKKRKQSRAARKKGRRKKKR
jgi:hypothetical protein